MMEVIEDLPEDVVGIAARGKITAEDYEQVVIPAIEAKLKTHDKIKLLFHMGQFEGMEIAAMWEDARFGLAHWTDFTHLALVSDDSWVRNMAAFFAWMIPAEVRLYSAAEADDARLWITTAQMSEAA